MARFRARTESVAIVSAARTDVWAALTDPQLLPTLTPLLRSIDADGDTWVWHMASIAALGVSVAPCFTEQMRFDDGRRIDYHHAPPAGARERAGAEGWYELTDHAGSAEPATRLAISLTVQVELPLPGLAAPAVQRVMKGVMDGTGERFAANLLTHLGARELSG